MSEAVAMRLRQLAREYLDGNLSYESYRRMRGQSLDSLVGFDAIPDEDPAVITQPRQERIPGSLTVPAPEKPASAAPLPAPARVPAPRLEPTATLDLQPEAKSKGTRLRLIITILVLVVGAGLTGLWIWSTQHGAANPAVPSVARQVAGTDSQPARALVQEFLDANDWSDSRIAQLNLAWKSLPDQDRASALSSDWYRDFVEVTRTRLKEQRALAADEEQGITGPLAELAASLGIDVR